MDEGLDDRFDVEDWAYVGEGKMRIACANVNPSHHMFGLLLSIPKLNDTGACSVSAATGSLVSDVATITGIMKDCFTTSYLSDVLRIVQLEQSFTAELTRRLDSQRPAGRKKDNELLLLTSALLQRNFNHLHRPLRSYGPLPLRATITIELKVKSGLKSSSPFLPDDRLIKLKHSTFGLQQMYTHAKAKQSEDLALSWGTLGAYSRYDPSKLCSRQYADVRDSLNVLLGSPRNNLRISINGRHLYGWDKVDIGALHRGMASAHNNLCGDESVGAHLRSTLDALASLLCAEDILERLQAMQRLDLLDAEGAALAFDRIVELAGSDDATTVILQQLHRPIQPSLFAFALQGLSLAPPVDCPPIVVELVRLKIHEGLSMEDVDERRRAALSLLASASMAEAALLLQLWMVALIAKDASVIVSIQRMDGPHTSAPNDAGVWEGRIVQRQSSSHCGLVFPPSGGSQGDSEEVAGYAYNVGIVDIGLKSVSKAKQKSVHDAAMCAMCQGLDSTHFV
ncbi:inositol-pentakisphosphate 2-kinase [Ochromonadaceae sp. CCMP2298]|nr:inositol-pentakisphosphate 2-kinase [Ochromonadaceae sp. CCMP2298]|mmetsp:Transcript_31637/g.69701  ORF Transcript_31637/g.69701 Transcript_31637/m.69701 type:complete len:510 (+) Transcript_31637:182-1711(+)